MEVKTGVKVHTTVGKYEGVDYVVMPRTEFKVLVDAMEMFGIKVQWFEYMGEEEDK